MNFNKNILASVTGLLTALLFSSTYFLGAFDELHFFTSDILKTTFTEKSDNEDIIYLLITDASLIEADELDGIRWPWPRESYGEAIKFLESSGAKHIAFDLTFSETSVYGPEDDEAFAKSLTTSKPTLSYLSTIHKENASATKRDRNKEMMASSVLDVVIQDFKGRINEVKYFRPPVKTLAKEVKSLGDVKFSADTDGVGRRVSMLFREGENYYPSFALAVAMKTLGATRVTLTGNEILLSGENISRSIPVDNGGMTTLKFYGDSSFYKKYLLLRTIKSQAKIDAGEEPYYNPDLFKDKIVLIAADATDLKDLRPNPFNKINDPGIHYQGTAIDNILKGEFIREFYGPVIVIPIIIILSLLTSVISSRTNAFAGLIFTLLLISFYLLSGIYLFRNHDMLVDLSAVSLSVLAAFFLTEVANFVMASRQKAFLLGAFGQYLSPKVIADLMKHPSKLKPGGERKIMTAFFSDIKGFSGIAEKLSPEKLVSLLNEYLGEMCDIIGMYEGVVDKFQGDAVMAFWGAPVETGKHAALACRASLVMQKKLLQLREKWQKGGKYELFVRMGINSGPMVVGNLGSNRRMNYTVMGDTVNLASRLEGTNKLYGTNILISEYTHHLVKDEFESRELDIIKVVGKNEPVIIHELIDLKGSVGENIVKGVEIFESAIELYRKRQFEEATETFRQVLNFIPEDPPTKLYLNRCREFIKQQPPDDWNGICVLTQK